MASLKLLGDAQNSRRRRVIAQIFGSTSNAGTVTSARRVASGLPARAAAALTEVKVFRDPWSNSYLVSMLFAVDNLAKAKALVESPGLKAHMESAGVVGPTSARFLKEDV